MVLLHTLPPEHALRRRELRAIGAECRNLKSKVWRPVEKWAIGHITYNDLGPTWTDTNEFRAPDPSTTEEAPDAQ